MTCPACSGTGVRDYGPFSMICRTCHGLPYQSDADLTRAYFAAAGEAERLRRLLAERGMIPVPPQQKGEL